MRRILSFCGSLWWFVYAYIYMVDPHNHLPPSPTTNHQHTQPTTPPTKVLARRDAYGNNRPPPCPKTSVLKILLRQLADFIVLILLAGACVWVAECVCVLWDGMCVFCGACVDAVCLSARCIYRTPKSLYQLTN